MGKVCHVTIQANNTAHAHVWAVGVRGSRSCVCVLYFNVSTTLRCPEIILMLTGALSHCGWRWKFHQSLWRSVEVVSAFYLKRVWMPSDWTLRCSEVSVMLVGTLLLTLEIWLEFVWVRFCCFISEISQQPGSVYFSSLRLSKSIHAVVSYLTKRTFYIS